MAPRQFNLSSANLEFQRGEEVSTNVLVAQMQDELIGAVIQQRIATTTDALMGLLPSIKRLTDEQCRGIIARYTAVLEGNFIYWMTATSLAVHSEEARAILMENLHEEVRDSHPVMLRRFAIAANAFPTDKDALSINTELTKVRLFLGRLRGVPSVLTMAFFEGFIQQFMGYLADLAAARGSAEREYTEVHGVCDIAHSQELFRAVSLEMALNPVRDESDLFEGVELLRTLLYSILRVSTIN